MFPCILFSHKYYKISAALVSPEAFNVYLALFWDTLFGFQFANALFIMRYTHNRSTRLWNAFWVFVLYPLVWIGLVKDRIQENEEARAKAAALQEQKDDKNSNKEKK